MARTSKYCMTVTFQPNGQSLRTMAFQGRRGLEYNADGLGSPSYFRRLKRYE